jgi:hypothetical protein
MTGRRDREAELRSRLLELAARLVDLAVEPGSKQRDRLERIRAELELDPDRLNTHIAAAVGGRKQDVLRLVKLARVLPPRFPSVPGGVNDADPTPEVDDR